MEFKCYASGSSGNLYTVENNTTRIMIECGIVFNKLQQLMSYKLHDIEGCLITHYHKDHCKAFKEVASAGIDLYMTQETRANLGASGHRVNVIKPLKQFDIKDFTVLPFESEHDVEGSVGFVVKCKITQQALLFLTDSFYCRYKFKGLTMIAIECNYSDELLRENINNGTVDKGRLHRIQKSHFSLTHLKDFLLANDLSMVSEIYLIHLSDSNAHAEIIKKEVQETTGKLIKLC